MIQMGLALGTYLEEGTEDGVRKASTVLIYRTHCRNVPPLNGQDTFIEIKLMMIQSKKKERATESF